MELDPFSLSPGQQVSEESSGCFREVREDQPLRSTETAYQRSLLRAFPSHFQRVDDLASSRCTPPIENAGKQTAMYSAPSDAGLLY